MRKTVYPVLGTALWGWTIAENAAFELLDAYYARGGRWVDTASNYPINKKPADFRRAENLLACWLKRNAVADLEIITKVGSLDNMGSSRINLEPSFLLICQDHYRRLFGSCHRCLMIHWDDRDMPGEVAATVSALQTIAENSVTIGLSGIRHPEYYINLRANPMIEVKHNVLSRDDLARYAVFGRHPQFLVYGLTLGGVAKTEGKQISAPARGLADADLSVYLRFIAASETHPAWPQNLHQLGMLFAFHAEGVEGLILGPSNPVQLEESLRYLTLLNEHDTSDIFASLKRYESGPVL